MSDAGAMAGIGGLADVSRRTAHEQVVEELRRGILGGTLAPGTPLVLAELAAQLGVSRTPIREAIRDLASEGLVDVDSYRSSVVHTPTAAEAEEVYELRLLLEPLAVRSAVERATDADLARARELQRAMARSDDAGRWVLLNRDFHAALLAPAASSKLLGILASLRDAATIHVALSLRADRSQRAASDRQHAALLDAYTRRDAELAVELTIAHLRATLDALDADERRG
jgi:DNA-binding GntR family transcriptional regulator